MSYGYNPYEEADPPCALCGKDPYDCACPECPKCGFAGDPDCYNPDGCGGLVPKTETCSFCGFVGAFITHSGWDGYPFCPECHGI